MTTETKVSAHEYAFPIVAMLAASVFSCLVLFSLVAFPDAAKADGPAGSPGDQWVWEPDYVWYDSYDVYEPYYPDDQWTWEPDYYSYDTYDVYEGYDDYYWVEYSDSYWYDDSYYNHAYYNDYSYDYYDDYWYYDYDHGCNSYCNPPPYDHCPNIPGNQPSGYDCYPDHDREPVCAIDADDETIEEGDSTTLRWTSENATSASLTSFGSVSTGGSRTVSPTSDKTYTLTVRDNDGDTDTCSVHINVEEDDDDEDLSCELDASDTRVDEGDEVTLEWEIDGDADYASINQGIGRVDEDGGEEDVEVDEDTTFRLTVRNDEGDEDTCSVTVRVDEERDFSSISFSGGPVNNPPVVYLSQIPYTGLEDITPSMWGFIITLLGLLGFGSYYVFVKRRQAA